MVVESTKMGDNKITKRGRSRVRTTANQFEIIVRAMEANPKLFGGMLGVRSSKDWKELVSKLNENSYGGAIKNVKEWLKCWADKKSDCKKKYRQIIAAKEEGKPCEEILYDIEARILTLAGIDVTGLQTREKPYSCLLKYSPKIVDVSSLTTDTAAVPFDQVSDYTTDIEAILTGNTGSLPSATAPDESSQPAQVPQSTRYRALLPKRPNPSLDPHEANKELKESPPQLIEPSPQQEESLFQLKKSPSQLIEPSPQQEESLFQLKQSPSQLIEPSPQQKESPSLTGEGSEFEAFCQSLSIQLRRMPLHRALICQEKLQSVMTQERLFQLTQPSSAALLASSSAYHHSLAILNSSQHDEHQ